MLDNSRIAIELKNYMSAPELEAWMRVLGYVYEKTLADVPEPEPPSGD